MIESERLRLRPFRDDDLHLLEEWGQAREGLWGSYQCFQLDHLPRLLAAYRDNGLLSRDFAILLIEDRADGSVLGFVRYTLVRLPDADLPYPEIGYGVPNEQRRGQGVATEATRLLVDYLFAGYPCERIAAFVDVENTPSRRVLEKVGFEQEGTLRRATFRDGRWRDVAVYALLR
jgi:RimJ/RimL family protein N-acetyltransferase